MTGPASVQGTNAGAPQWGSDVVAQFLRTAGVPYITLNPGASFRGLHDSLVNFLHDQDPRMLVCLHEEHAVALAHGYAKVTGQPLAVALHSNVGLMHASMAIYNAWVDRVPVFLIGATGPVDAAKRRPWIDWIHTASDQAALVRAYVKWDDQPMSVEATVESLARAWEIVRTPPHGPTYVVLDAEVQEQALAGPVPLTAVRTCPVADVPVASANSVRRAAQLLQQASRPVVLMGRVGRDAFAWERRVQLVELLGARVVTDLKAGAAFPTLHEAHVPGPGFFLSSAGKEALAAADVVLALDWIDLAGTMKQAPAGGDRRMVSVTLDAQLHNGWSKDHQGYLPVDVTLPTRPDTAVDQLVDALEPRPTPARPRAQPSTPEDVSEDGVTDPKPIELPVLARLLRHAVHGMDTCLVRLPLGWDGDDWPFDHPLDYLGYDGGGGIGSGPGMLVGAALALRGAGRLPVAVLGDGDYLMGVQALWTAAHEQIPLLAVVANNRSYFNDEVHQERVARVRDRDVSRRWVGQRIDDPAPDLAALARAQGLEGIGPVGTVDELAKALPAAVALVRDGKPVVVDVVVEPGYTPAMSSGLTRTS
jgi:thiamine pyrophosphate-dependent acetolactate synthase large subunit-like protein